MTVNFTASTSLIGSNRRLRAYRPSSYETDVLFEIKGQNTAGRIAAEGLVKVSRPTAIELAVHLLEELAPELLKPKPELKFSELPVGTYLRNKKTKLVVKVVEKDERFEAYALDDKTATAEDENGDIIVPVQEPFDADYGWDIVEAKPVIRFEVVE